MVFLYKARTLIFLLLVLPLVAGNAQEPFLLSERVGSEIDSLEIAYFYLFPYYRNLHSTNLTIENDSTVKLQGTRLYRGEYRDTTDYIPLSRLQQVGVIVDRYEDYGQHDSLPDFAMVRSLIAPVLPSMQGTTYEVVLRDGTTYSDEIFAVNDSGFFLWNSKESFDWHQPWENVEYISSKELYRLKSPSSYRFLVGSLLGGGVGIGLGVLVYNETESIVSSLSTVAGLASLGLSLASDSKFAIVDGSSSKYRDEIKNLYGSAATDKRVPLELDRSDLFGATSESSLASYFTDVDQLRMYSSFNPYSLEVGMRSTWVRSNATEIPMRISGRDQSVDFDFQLPDALNIRFEWRPQRNIELFAQTAALTFAGDVSNQTVPLRELFGIGADYRVELIGNEETKDVAEVTVHPSLGLHLYYFGFEHDLGPFFSKPVEYNDVFVVSSIGAILKSQIRLSEDLLIVNSIHPSANIDVINIPENVLETPGGGGTRVVFKSFGVGPYFSVDFQLGVKYSF